MEELDGCHEGRYNIEVTKLKTVIYSKSLFYFFFSNVRNIKKRKCPFDEIPCSPLKVVKCTMQNSAKKHQQLKEKKKRGVFYVRTSICQRYPIILFIPPVVLITEIYVRTTGCFCGVCNKRYNGKGSWIGCDGECQNWYHFNCVGLSMKDEPPKGDWFCPKCSTTLD